MRARFRSCLNCAFETPCGRTWTGLCSPLEVARVRALVGPATTLVTPGVRSAGAAAGDQKRVATPAEAIVNGADYLVIGRQVTRAADSRGEMLRILDEIQLRK